MEFFESLGYDGMMLFLAYHEMKNDYKTARSYVEAEAEAAATND